MSPDEVFVTELLRALADSKLEAIVVGSTAAVLQGAPVMTQDIDLLIRDTPRNQQKLARLCSKLGGALVEVSPLSRTRRVMGLAISVDVLLDQIAGELSFARLRSRAVKIPIGDQVAVVASLEDVITSKQAANRAKDLAQLPILRDTLRIKAALDEP